ncbi:MAG: outer membrane lipid asymmetry maintenance protein MlaD [Coraliomargaritaceae bacterium]
MTQRNTEIIAGVFVIIGLAAVLYLSFQVGGARLFNNGSYLLHAQFSSAAGVNPGSRVEIAGVRVGTVKKIDLNGDFYARVTLEINSGIELDDDTIASVKTSGLIGDRYINLMPGGSGLPLEPNDLILDTESPLDIEGLISRFAMGGLDERED